jgi:hypothetical protein
MKVCHAPLKIFGSPLIGIQFNHVSRDFIIYFDSFAKICQIEGSEREWRQWYEKERPEEEEIPCGYQKSLDVFRRLLLIRSWSPDRTLSQARHYVMSINITFCPVLSARNLYM